MDGNNIELQSGDSGSSINEVKKDFRIPPMVQGEAIAQSRFSLPPDLQGKVITIDDPRAKSPSEGWPQPPLKGFSYLSQQLIQIYKTNPIIQDISDFLHAEVEPIELQNKPEKLLLTSEEATKQYGNGFVIQGPVTVEQAQEQAAYKRDIAERQQRLNNGEPGYVVYATAKTLEFGSNIATPLDLLAAFFLVIFLKKLNWRAIRKSTVVFITYPFSQILNLKTMSKKIINKSEHLQLIEKHMRYSIKRFQSLSPESRALIIIPIAWLFLIAIYFLLSVNWDYLEFNWTDFKYRQFWYKITLLPLLAFWISYAVYKLIGSKKNGAGFAPDRD